MKNPCYDEILHKSCSRRCVGCASTCKDWQDYVSERNLKYKNKVCDNVVDNYEIARHCRFQAQLKKKKSFKLR